MNKWENNLKNHEQSCCCSSNQGLFVPNRQLSLIVASILFLTFSIFVTGYFLGKKNAVEQFSEKMHKDAFADQVYATVLANTQNNEQSHPNRLLVTDAQAFEMQKQPIDQDVSFEKSEAVVNLAGSENNTDPQGSSSLLYYAQLIGFGTERAAQAFVSKLASKGIETEIKKRVSKSVKGRTSYWYQVVTSAYSNKNELIELVNKITKEENIKDANIRVC